MRRQVDLQSERGTNATLYSTPAALNELKPGAHHDFVARHDLDQIETHSLICTASYVSPYTGERRQAVQRFNFRVEHALSVRTKVTFAPATITTSDLPQRSLHVPHSDHGVPTRADVPADSGSRRVCFVGSLPGK
jgi:hypothetical protein